MRKATVVTAAIMAAAVMLTVGCNGTMPGPIPPHDGTYPIGVAAGDVVEPGTYWTPQAECHWKVTGDRPRSNDGPGSVTLDEDHDNTITTRHCTAWQKLDR